MSVDKWDQRQLCPDGACVGVITSTGTCGVCGRAAPNWGEPRTRGLLEGPESQAAADDNADADEAEDDLAPPVTRTRAPAGLARTWTERQVCSDGACIGLIGATGVCKVCGRSAGQEMPLVVPLDLPDGDLDADDDPDDDEDQDEAAQHGDDEDDSSEDEEDYADDDEEDLFDDDEGDGADERGPQSEEDKQLAAAASELAPVAIAEAEAAASDDRKLCPDGACVGVIGADGRCKLCGKAGT